MFKYLPKKINVIDNDRSRIELNDISTKLLLDLSFSEVKTVYEIFSASGAIGIYAALVNPDIRIDEIVANVQDYETVRTNINNNKIRLGSVSPVNQLNGLRQKADIIIIKLILEKRKQFILKTVNRVASFLQANGVIYLVGAKNEGVQSITKQLSILFGTKPETITYKQGTHLIKIKPAVKHSLTSPINLPQNYQNIEIRNIKLRLTLDESVFAKGGLDAAARLLAENMTINDDDKVLDLGCGSGVLGMVAKRLAKNVEVVLVDSDYATVDLCRQNIELNNLTNCRVLASDGTGGVGGEKFDVIVTNPPFHQGKQTSHSVTEQFVEESYHALLPWGKLFVVCNIFIPSEEIIQGVFGNHELVSKNRSYKVICAIRH